MSSTTELFFYNWVTVLFVSCTKVERYTFLQLVSHYSTDPQVGIRQERRRLVLNMFVNKAGLKSSLANDL